MKKIILFIGICLMSCSLWATNIIGKVLDNNTRQAVDFANVALFAAGDSVPLYGAITDATGQFDLHNVKEGRYTLLVSFMGYTEYRKEIQVNARELHLGHILLSEDTQALQEVEVVAQGSTMRFELDKKIFTVDQNIAAAGANITDVLENLPTVDVDQDGSISLRNSESVEIWINGKPAGLTAENRADILRQMPADAIKEIEVITNPSAKYSPEGSSGVINIVMKKDRKAGYYGSVVAGLDYALSKPWNVPPGANASLNLNFSKGIMDGYVNIGYRFHVRNGSNQSDRYMLHGAGARNLEDTPTDSIYQVLQSDGWNNSRGHGMFLRAGMNWQIGNWSSLGVSGFGMLSDPKAFRSQDSNRTAYLLTTYPLATAETDTLRQYERLETGSGWHPGGNVMLDYSLKYGKHQLMITATYNHWTWNSDKIFTNQQNGTISNQQRQYNENKDQGVEIKADYEWKPTTQSRFEAGYQANINHKTTLAEAFDGEHRDPSAEIFDFYSDFRSQEQNHALYVTYGNRWWNKLSLQIGLRGEVQTRHLESLYKNADGTTIDAYASVPSKRDTTYWQLYPSAYISYDFGKGNELQINYTRRVDRPRGHTLNPRQNLSDSTNISCGNPDLLPAYSNNMELNYLKIWDRHTLSIGGFWRYKEDIVQNVSFMDGKLMRNTWVNVGNRHELGGEITAKNRFFKEVMQMTTTLECYYNGMKGGHYEFLYAGRPASIDLKKQSAVTWSAKVQMNFLFTKTFTGQISARYRSPRVLAQGYSTHSYNIDLGLRKTFLNRKLALAFNVRDILDSRARRSTTWGEGFWQNSQRRWNSRTASLTLTYSFGNQNPKRDNKQRSGSDMGSGGGFEDGGMEE